MSENKIPFYWIVVFMLMFFIPIVSIAIDCCIHHSPLSWIVIGKWFVFWAVGVRLFTAGIRQAINPGFTAQDIFHITDKESLVIVKELGFANISIGLIGMLALFKTEWCQAGAIVGCIFMGIAGVQHILKKPGSKNETIAMVSDLWIAVISMLYLVFTFHL